MSRELHPACAKWPWPSEAEVTKLADDIRANGLLHDISLTKDGLLLDGKVREKACEIAGIEPRFVTYQGDDPFGFTVSQNALRRHLPHGELAFLMEELATLRHGGSRLKKASPHMRACSSGRSVTAVAAASGGAIGRPSIEDARAIKRYGTPNVIELAKSGAVGLRYAANYARNTPQDEQAKAVARDIIRKGGAIAERYRAKPDAKSGTKSDKERMIAVGEVIKTLRPLVRKLKEQSRQRYFMVSLASLGLICSAFEMIFQAWARGDAAEVARISRHIESNYIRDSSAGENNAFYDENTKAQQ